MARGSWEGHTACLGWTREALSVRVDRLQGSRGLAGPIL